MTLLPSLALSTGVLSFSWDFASSELRRSGTETWWENVYSFPLRLFFSRQLNNQHQNTIFLKKKNSCMKEALIFTKFWTLFTQNISSWSLENATAQVDLVKSGSFSFRSKTKSTTIAFSFFSPPFLLLALSWRSVFSFHGRIFGLIRHLGGELQLIFAGYVSLAS